MTELKSLPKLPPINYDVFLNRVKYDIIKDIEEIVTQETYVFRTPKSKDISDIICTDFKNVKSISFEVNWNKFYTNNISDNNQIVRLFTDYYYVNSQTCFVTTAMTVEPIDCNLPISYSLKFKEHILLHDLNKVNSIDVYTPSFESDKYIYYTGGCCSTQNYLPLDQFKTNYAIITKPVPGTSVYCVYSHDLHKFKEEPILKQIWDNIPPYELYSNPPCNCFTIKDENVEAFKSLVSKYNTDALYRGTDEIVDQEATDDHRLKYNLKYVKDYNNLINSEVINNNKINYSDINNYKDNKEFRVLVVECHPWLLDDLKI